MPSRAAERGRRPRNARVEYAPGVPLVDALHTVGPVFRPGQWRAAHAVGRAAGGWAGGKMDERRASLRVEMRRQRLGPSPAQVAGFSSPFRR
jgi:hypothetical protein